MASLYEYFVKDGAQDLTIRKTWPISDRASGATVGEVIARLHLDYDANAKYISFFIPEMPGVDCPEALVLNKVPEILEWPTTQVGIRMGQHAEGRDAREFTFTGQIYLYTERATLDGDKARLSAEAQAVGYRLTFRGRWAWAGIKRSSQDKSAPGQRDGGLDCPVHWSRAATGTPWRPFSSDQAGRSPTPISAPPFPSWASVHIGEA